MQGRVVTRSTAGPGPVSVPYTYSCTSQHACMAIQSGPETCAGRARGLDATAYWCARRSAASAGRYGRFEVRGTLHCWGAIVSLQARAPGRMGRGRRRRGPAHLGASVDFTRGSARPGGRVPIVDGYADTTLRRGAYTGRRLEARVRELRGGQQNLRPSRPATTKTKKVQPRIVWIYQCSV